MPKKKPQLNYNLFETPAPPKEEPHGWEKPNESKEAVPSGKADATACPRCSRASQPSVRPLESGGSRYCVTCAGPDGCFYFTPEVAE